MDLLSQNVDSLAGHEKFLIFYKFQLSLEIPANLCQDILSSASKYFKTIV